MKKFNIKKDPWICTTKLSAVDLNGIVILMKSAGITVGSNGESTDNIKAYPYLGSWGKETLIDEEDMHDRWSAVTKSAWDNRMTLKQLREILIKMIKKRKV